MKNHSISNTLCLSMVFAASCFLFAASFSGTAYSAVVITTPGVGVSYYGYGYRHGYGYGYGYGHGGAAYYHHGAAYHGGAAGYHHGAAGYHHGGVHRGYHR